MTLPTEKNTPGQTPLNKKMLVYAEPKVGKSTMVSKLFPDAIFIAADPTGLEELPVFRVPFDRPVKDWVEFRKIGAEIAQLREQEGFPYEAIVIDTIDELSRLCTEHVLSQLPGGPDAKTFKHASDWEYGKAWNAISEEFRIRVAKICSLGLPVVFISHAKIKPVTKKTRTGVKYEVVVATPDIGSGGLRDWLLKFVDYIFYAEVIHEDGEERRVIRTTPSESYLAGARQPEGRTPIDATLPLDGARLRQALQATAVKPPSPSPEEVVPQSSPNAPVRQKKTTTKEKTTA